MVITAAAAVAFSRTGDPASGEFEDAVVIKGFSACRRRTPGKQKDHA